MGNGKIENSERKKKGPSRQEREKEKHGRNIGAEKGHMARDHNVGGKDFPYNRRTRKQG